MPINRSWKHVRNRRLLGKLFGAAGNCRVLMETARKRSYGSGNFAVRNERKCLDLETTAPVSNSTVIILICIFLSGAVFLVC